MGRYVIRRLLLLIPVLFFISIITFSLAHAVPGGPFDREKALPPDCLLYTSDAADDLLCVDLGGCRILQKKNKQMI